MAISWAFESPTRVMGSSASLFFMVASEPATVELVAKAEQTMLDLIKTQGQVSFMMVIQPSRTARVSAEARERIAQMLKAIAKGCVGQVMVIEASGLRGTIVRTFLTGLMLLGGGNGYPTTVVKTVREGLDWLSSLPNQPAGFSLARRDVEGYLDEKRRAEELTRAG